MKRRKNVSLYPSVKFLRSSTTLETFTCLEKQPKTQQHQHNGNETRTFYEKLLGETSQKYTKNKPERDNVECGHAEDINNERKDNKSSIKEKSEIKSSTYVTKQVHLFLRMAQEGDLDGVQRLLESCKVDINATDQFGWTAIMCACHSGHISCVRYLLKQGARKDLCNNMGETVEDIAKKHHESSIYNIFKKHKPRKGHRLKTGNYDTIEELATTSFCDICNIKYTSSTMEHNTSTVHLFNCQYKSEKTVYHIPETNIGFQLMTKTGWDKEKGLGPEGKGRKFPIKTILKQDRQGLGNKQKEKAKITHFAPQDATAVKRNKNKVEQRVPKRTSKRKMIEKQMKERKWEQNMRMYMNTD